MAEGAAIAVGPPGPGELGPAARVLAAAFVDDPVWTAVGPRRRGHRRRANRAAFWGIVHASARSDARIRVARFEGEVVGATIVFDPGRWPIPDAAAVWELGWCLAAGPAPVYRGLRDDRAMRAAHIEHPHVYLWFIGVAPGVHGRGVGRALMAELHARAEQLEVPTYLETGTAANVVFYESLGYGVEGEVALPSGARMWQMERPSVVPGAGVPVAGDGSASAASSR